MNISRSNTRDAFPLSVKKPLKKTLIAVFSFFFLYVTAIFFIYFPLSAKTTISPVLVVFLGLAILVISIIAEYIYQLYYYASYYYELTESFIIIRKGVIANREITVPYARIQDVYVDQDILDRIFGLYDVHIASATISSGFEAHIDGVLKDGADGLKAAILAKTQAINKPNIPLPPQKATTVVQTV